jgi:hypothetical protein
MKQPKEMEGTQLMTGKGGMVKEPLRSVKDVLNKVKKPGGK